MQQKKTEGFIELIWIKFAERCLGTSLLLFCLTIFSRIKNIVTKVHNRAIILIKITLFIYRENLGVHNYGCWSKRLHRSIISKEICR